MLLTLLDKEGGLFKRKAVTNGGEYAGPCPWCGGRDRFIVWPGEGDTGRYWCRQCGKRGDAIQYLRDRQGMGYREACDALSIIPKNRFNVGQNKKYEKWVPKKARTPEKIWREQAAIFLKQSQDNLYGSRAGDSIRQWLIQERGLSEQTLAMSGIGLCLKNDWMPRKAWGLEENGKKLWFPSGIVIPYKKHREPVRIRIRRFGDQRPRYYLLPGSSTAPMVLCSKPRLAVLVIESEMDALLVWQEAKDLVNVVGLGAAQIRPDRKTHQLFEKAGRIFLALDADGAGVKQAWDWWKHQYGDKWERLPPVMGKDPGEMYRAGVSIRQWLLAGIFCGKQMQ